MKVFLSKFEIDISEISWKPIKTGFQLLNKPMTLGLKASFWGLFKTNFCGLFRKVFLFTKLKFLNFGKKFLQTILRSMCLELLNFRVKEMVYFSVIQLSSCTFINRKLYCSAGNQKTKKNK